MPLGIPHLGGEKKLAEKMQDGKSWSPKKGLCVHTRDPKHGIHPPKKNHF